MCCAVKSQYHAWLVTYIPEGEGRMLLVDRLDDLIFPESPEALTEHLTDSVHHDDVYDEVVQSLEAKRTRSIEAIHPQAGQL